MVAPIWSATTKKQKTLLWGDDSKGDGGGIKGRYVIYWRGGSGLGLQRGGSSMKFWSNGGGSRLLNLWKSGEGHAFRYRNHKLCKISNAFSAIQGAQISKFSRGACPRTPLASECFHIHVNPISCVPHSIHHMSLQCQCLTNLSKFGQDTLRTSWALVTSFKNIWSTPQHFLSELKFTEVRSLTKSTNLIFVRRVAGTTFEDSFMTWLNEIQCFATVLWWCVTTRKQPVRSDQLYQEGLRGDGEGHTFLGIFCEGSCFSFAGPGGRVRTLEPLPPPPPPNKKRTFPQYRLGWRGRGRLTVFPRTAHTWRTPREVQHSVRFCMQMRVLLPEALLPALSSHCWSCVLRSSSKSIRDGAHAGMPREWKLRASSYEPGWPSWSGYNT